VSIGLTLGSHSDWLQLTTKRLSLGPWSVIAALVAEAESNEEFFIPDGRDLGLSMDGSAEEAICTPRICLLGSQTR
jgi:hypothetical protein